MHEYCIAQPLNHQLSPTCCSSAEELLCWLLHSQVCLFVIGWRIGFAILHTKSWRTLRWIYSVYSGPLSLDHFFGSYMRGLMGIASFLLSWFHVIKNTTKHKHTYVGIYMYVHILWPLLPFGSQIFTSSPSPILLVVWNFGQEMQYCIRSMTKLPEFLSLHLVDNIIASN